MYNHTFLNQFSFRINFLFWWPLHTAFIIKPHPTYFTLLTTRIFAQGLPHCSVLSPLLFVVYINDMIAGLTDRVNVSAFADDLTV